MQKFSYYHMAEEGEDKSLAYLQAHFSSASIFPPSLYCLRMHNIYRYYIVLCILYYVQMIFILFFYLFQLHKMLALRFNIISLINIHIYIFLYIYAIYILIHVLNFVFLCNIVLLGKNGNKIVCLTFVYIEKPASCCSTLVIVLILSSLGFPFFADV